MTQRQDLLNVHGVAQRLGVSAWTVREMIWAGRLACVRIGRLIRVDPDDLDRFIEQNRFRERQHQ